MAQTAVFIEMNSDNHSCLGFLSYIPDEADLRCLAEDNELTGDVTGDYFAYNIGAGESGTDNFLSEEDLKDLYDKGNFEKDLEKEFNLGASIYESGSVSVYVDDEEE